MNAPITCLCLAAIVSSSSAGGLLVGSATEDITPDQAVALAGQFSTRISRKAETPIVAAVLALESTNDGTAADHALIISCDLVAIRTPVLDAIRAKLKPLLPEVDMRKVIVTATHTHTAPVTTELSENRYLYEIPKEGVMQPEEYIELLSERIAKASVRAWRSRKPAGVSWTLGHAVVGQNRRMVYADGRAQMYGKTNDARFRNIEGAEDHGVELLFFWDAQRKLMAVSINLACPSQEVESRSAINADFWHEVREQLKAKLALPDLTILGWCGAAGDQSPHLMYRKAAEDRMLKARGLTRLQEIGRRITSAVLDTMDAAKADIRTDVPFAHSVEPVALPPRRILPREYEDSKKAVAQFSLITKPDNKMRTMLDRDRDVLRRHEEADRLPPFEIELHALRIGEIAIATNPFELFLDYGLQMKARSPSEQTFLIQLTNGSGGYLPTPKAIEGGSYSGLPHTNKVGPEGGQLLVDKTVAAIQRFWPAVVRH